MCNSKHLSWKVAIVEDKPSKIIRNILVISKKYEFIDTHCDLFISSFSQWGRKLQDLEGEVNIREVVQNYTNAIFCVDLNNHLSGLGF